MTFRRTVATVVAIASTSALLAAQASRTDPLASLKTRAEATNFTETSRYDDIESFLDTVDRASPLVHVTSFGYTFEGRRLLLARRDPRCVGVPSE